MKDNTLYMWRLVTMKEVSVLDASDDVIKFGDKAYKADGNGVVMQLTEGKLKALMALLEKIEEEA